MKFLKRSNGISIRFVFLLGFLRLFFDVRTAAAQDEQRCGTTAEGADYFLRFQHLLHQRRTADKGRTEEEILSIPLIFHVIHHGEAVGKGCNIAAEQIFAQIDVLNEDFRRRNADANRTLPIFRDVAADTRIEFYLAATDPEGNPLPEPGIRRVYFPRPAGGRLNIGLIDSLIKPATIWDPARYLNVWVVDNIGQNIAGYAQFPDLSGLGGLPNLPSLAERDGVVVRYNRLGSILKTPWALPLREQPVPRRFDRGRTLTHEIGHFLGLLHPFHNGCTETNDYCEDTPKTSAPVLLCPDNPRGCDGPAMSQNFMDFTDDACMNLFTACQAARMRQTLTLSPRRRELINSNVGRGDVQVFLQNINLINQLRIYPDSDVGIIRIESPHPLTGSRYEIYNVAGQLVAAGDVESTQNEIRPFKSAVGIYLLKLITPQGIVVRKLYWR